MSPAPSEPVPVYVGGHTDAALRRAARIGDGWTSAMITFDELRTVIDAAAAAARGVRPGRVPFEIQAVCIDRFGLRRLPRSRPTPASPTRSWCRGCSTASGFDGPLEAKKDGMRRFADDIMGKL